MYSVAVGIRPYGQLVEHYEENMLSQMRAAESHLHRRSKESSKVSQNSSLLVDDCVFVHVASPMWYIIHSAREGGDREKTSSV